jgi:hypothetical protein
MLFHAESGRIYTDMLVSHYRLYCKQGVWLTHENGERWEDLHGGPTTLHAHSRDAAELGFYQACKTARACRKLVPWRSSTRTRASAGAPPVGSSWASVCTPGS